MIPYLTPDAAKGDGRSDDVAALQAFLNAAATAGVPAYFPRKSYRLGATGLHYGSNAVIVQAGDLLNDHPNAAVGTQHCLAGPSSGRVSNVTIRGEGGAMRCGASALGTSTRKGLGVTNTDGFDVSGVQTAGGLNGFGMEVKNSSQGVLNRLRLMSGLNTPGADGLHFFGAVSRVTGSDIQVSSGDDALSLTCEAGGESQDATLERISLSNLQLDSAAFSCIKMYTDMGTGKATIRRISLSGVSGRISQGANGCPLMIENYGKANGCSIEDIAIDGADLDFGATTAEGPNAYIVGARGVSMTRMIQRGRIDEFLRAVDCSGLVLHGDVFETGGPTKTAPIQMEGCSDYDINLVVRDKTGKRLGTIVHSQSGTDTGVVAIQMTPV